MKKILLFVFFGFSFYTKAEDIAPVIIDPPQENQILRDTSKFHRLNKSMLITIQVVGIGPSPGYAQSGATIGKYLTADSLMTIEFTKGRGSSLNWFYSDYDISTFSAGLGYSKFVANSFYYRLGADYRTVDYRYTSRDLFTSAIVREDKFKGESVVATLAIGNQWQWENFTLGCDWIGYQYL